MVERRKSISQSRWHKRRQRRFRGVSLWRETTRYVCVKWVRQWRQSVKEGRICWNKVMSLIWSYCQIVSLIFKIVKRKWREMWRKKKWIHYFFWNLISLNVSKCLGISRSTLQRTLDTTTGVMWTAGINVAAVMSSLSTGCKPTRSQRASSLLLWAQDVCLVMLFFVQRTQK